ncbi:MAG: hypothetical protein N2235_00810, partial [Fischerella sp.]|nr:hypothetical protein [Fischerella sp.]
LFHHQDTKTLRQIHHFQIPWGTAKSELNRTICVRHGKPRGGSMFNNFSSPCCGLFARGRLT